jgi:hypothetical protein
LVPVHGPEMVHTLPFEPETRLYTGHRIVLFIDRFLLPETMRCYDTGASSPEPSQQLRYLSAFTAS